MKLIEQSWSWVGKPDGEEALRLLELAGRTCYKSEDKITDESAPVFAGKMIKSGHHAMVEFANIPTVRVITNRGVTHEIVRHRVGMSYAQESTRYCDYTDEMLFIEPVWDLSEGMMQHSKEVFMESLIQAEENYRSLRLKGWSPQQAREVLPNALKTEICINGNCRSWRHFFHLRASRFAHPQMRSLAQDMLRGFRAEYPGLFDDVGDLDS